MYILQEGKLYIQDGDSLVGIEIYPDKVLKVKGTETGYVIPYQMLTPFEVRCKFQLNDGGTYIFPKEELTLIPSDTQNGVDKNVTVDSVKKPVGRPPRK